MTRHLIIVDTETTGLIPGTHWPIEVAAVNVTTGQELYFVPAIPEGALDKAEGEALRINRYFERGLYAWKGSWAASEEMWGALWKMLSGNTLGGCNPSFDAAMIMAGYRAAKENGLRSFAPTPQVWHHRLADLAAYAGPALQLAPNELVGLAQICERLGVTNDDEHTALSDARATAECFRRVTSHYAKKMEPVQ